jgi:hypothetical protein
MLCGRFAVSSPATARRRLHQHAAEAGAPAHLLGKPLRRRVQRQFAAPRPPFSPGAGGKPAVGHRGGPTQRVRSVVTAREQSSQDAMAPSRRYCVKCVRR